MHYTLSISPSCTAACTDIPFARRLRFFSELDEIDTLRLPCCSVKALLDNVWLLQEIKWRNSNLLERLNNAKTAEIARGSDPTPANSPQHSASKRFVYSVVFYIPDPSFRAMGLSNLFEHKRKRRRHESKNTNLRHETFLASLHQTPSRRISLLFAAALARVSQRRAVCRLCAQFFLQFLLVVRSLFENNISQPTVQSFMSNWGILW